MKPARQPKPEKIPVLPDTPQQVAETFQSHGFKGTLENAFRQRIAFLKGKR